MKIGLIDIDSKIANLALMRISTYHKLQGDCVEIAFAMNARYYDLVYVSKVFKYSMLPILPKGTVVGGTGFDVKIKLPKEIELCAPDYSIYTRCDYSLQKFTNGCPNRCGFCVVPEKEGQLEDLRPMTLNPRGQWIYLLDNNLFASNNWESALDYLKESGQPVKFEGVDISILTAKQAERLNTIKLKKQIHIAWDDPNEDCIYNKIKSVIEIIPAYKLMCYVLIGYSSTKEEDLYRVEKLREIKVDPFVMCYDKNDTYQKRFARWVNRKQIFKSVKWVDYSGN